MCVFVFIVRNTLKWVGGAGCRKMKGKFTKSQAVNPLSEHGVKWSVLRLLHFGHLERLPETLW